LTEVEISFSQRGEDKDEGDSQFSISFISPSLWLSPPRGERTYFSLLGIKVKGRINVAVNGLNRSSGL
jgi:hypothetical protein